MNYKYATRYSFLILSLLYPGRDWKDKRFNEDHIFPKAEFHTKNLRARGYDYATIDACQKVYNTILNLDLLDDSENKSKNATPFDRWIKFRDDNFKERYLIPQIDNYGLDNFLEFIEARKKLLVKQIKNFSF